MPLNYRSTEDILGLARSVIGNNIKIIGTRDHNEKVTILQHYDEFTEANHIAEKIKEYVVNKDDNYSDISRFLPTMSSIGTKHIGDESKAQYSNFQNIIREMEKNNIAPKEKIEDKKISKVKHPRYGIGIVINETEDILEVEFEKYGKKELLKALDTVERL